MGPGAGEGERHDVADVDRPSGLMTLDPRWPRGRAMVFEGVGLRRGSATLLRDVSVVFEPGERTVIIGPSGAGKSTLLRLLNRLEDPTEGRIRVGETPLRSIAVRCVRQCVGLVFQNPRCLPGTVRANLEYPWLVRRREVPADAVLSQALEEVGLPGGWLGREVDVLSGGERQKLAIATALQMEPEILGMDEPTSGLDPESARLLAEALDRRARENGLRTIVVTHHRQHARWLGTRGVVMEAGRVVDEGAIEVVLERHDRVLESQGAGMAGS